MKGHPGRALRRGGAILFGAMVALVGTGVSANPPFGSQPITIVIGPPSLYTQTEPPPNGGCYMYQSYDNGLSTPLGSVFRGQDACGPWVLSPTMTGRTWLEDILGNTVAVGQPFGPQSGPGPDTTQGDYVVAVPNGPIPGMDYTMFFDTSISLQWPQYWGSTPDGCRVSGQTLHCTLAATYSYVPGTQGGVVP